jgi:fatty acid amide hydrolase
MWTDDGYFPPSPAVRRAVHEAADILRARGATVEPFEPPDVPAAVELYLSIVSADGGKSLKRLLRGSRVDWRVRWFLLPTMSPRLWHPAMVGLLRLFGQEETSRLVATGFPRSAYEYWQLTDRRSAYTRRFLQSLRASRLDAMIFPPHAMSAMPHGSAAYLVTAASYCFLPNVLGIPAGVVAATRVRADEEDARSPSRDIVSRVARNSDQGSAGLPIGVQVAAPHWREDVVLAVMGVLEEGFGARPDYPAKPPCVR